MTQEELNQALFDKADAEMENFKTWLLTQPPEEILNHAYVYSVKQDILLGLDSAELSEEQASALLQSPTPLEDIYKALDKWNVNMMADIMECIENRADAVIAENRLQSEIPLYPHPASFAREHGELEQYRASNRANVACKEAIEAAVREHFDGMYLSDDAAKDVIDAYGMERVAFVLANTVQLQDWDGRYSRRSKEWASTIPNYNSDTIRCNYALDSHPAVLDGFIDLVREEQQRSRTQEEKAQMPRVSVREKLQNQVRRTSPKHSAKSNRQER